MQDFRKWGRAELWQRKVQAGLLPATIALLMVLRPVRGLKGGTHGCGVQLSAKEWGVVLGYSESQVHNALRQAEDKGLIVRHQQTLPVSTLTARRKGGPCDVLLFKDAKARHKGPGEPLGNADAVSVVYLTDAGCRVVDAAGTTRAFLWGPSEQGRRQRFEVACGLLLALWKTLRTKLAAAWDRVAAVKKNCTPDVRPLRRSHSSTNVCSSSPNLWETPLPDGCGAAPEGRTSSRPDSERHAPPSSAGTQAHAPPGRAAPAGDCTAPHTSRPGGDGVDIPPVPENIVAGLPEALRPLFWGCWQHTTPVAKYRQPNPHYAGERGLLQSGEVEVWTPLLTMDRAWPERCRNAGRRERIYLEWKFRKVRKALREAWLHHEGQQAAAAEAAAAEAAAAAARAAEEHERDKAIVAENERKRRQQPGAGAW